MNFASKKVVFDFQLSNCFFAGHQIVLEFRLKLGLGGCGIGFGGYFMVLHILELIVELFTSVDFLPEAFIFSFELHVLHVELETEEGF